MQSSAFWFSLLAQTLLRGAGWLLLLLLAAPLVRRVSAARRAVIWQMAFAGLLLLPILLLVLPPLPVLKINRPVAAVMTTPQAQSVRPDPWLSSSARFPLPSWEHPDRTLPTPPIKSQPTKPVTGQAAVPAPSLAAIRPPTAVPAGFLQTKSGWMLFLVWSVGAVWSLIRLVASLSALRRLGRCTIAATPELSNAFRASADRPGLCSPTLRLAAPESRLRAPITWGILRPIVMLPSGYAQETESRCRAALLHELAHVKRRDWAWLLLAQTVCAFYWCVPLVWLAARRLCCETELACDDCVLATGVSAPDYATQILEVVRIMQTENVHLPISAMPMARLPLAEARIRAILDSTRKRQPTSLSILFMAAFLPAICIPLMSLRATAAPEVRKMALVASPASEPVVPAMSSPSIAEERSVPAAEAPLSISKTASRPSLPTVRLAVNGSASPRLALTTLRSAPPAPGLLVAPPPDEQQAIAWGQVVNGLQAGLRLVGTRTVFAPGEPIWQETYLRNKSATDVAIETRGGYEEQGDPLITNGKGARVKVLRYFGYGLMFTRSTHVGPGQMALVGRFSVGFHAPYSDHDEDRPHEMVPGISASAEGMALAIAGPGAYTLRQEITPMGPDKKWMKSISTGAIPLRIDNTPAVPIFPGHRDHVVHLADASIAWGAEQSGLQTGLFYLGTKSDYFVGERVRLIVVLRNVSKAPIRFRHETSFAFLNAPEVADAAGKKRTMTLTPEPEWKALNENGLVGVTYDMTFAPSADGPSRIRQSDIAPGQSVIGYYLTGFVIPPKWKDGTTVPGRYHMVQPVRLGLGGGEQLDTSLETGPLDLRIFDPDAGIAAR